MRAVAPKCCDCPVLKAKAAQRWRTFFMGQMTDRAFYGLSSGVTDLFRPQSVIQAVSRCVFFAFLLTISSTLAQSADPAESRILTYKQYARIKHDVPYVLEFELDKGSLLIYGGRHVFDPKDAQIGDIQSAWDRFRPDVAYNEGGNPPTAGSVKAAVEHYGEVGLVRFLAARDAVPVATFEPKDEDAIRAIHKKYSAEQVKVWYALRSFLTFRASKHAQTAEEFMTDVLSRASWKDTGLAEIVKNIPELQAACAKLFTGLKDWRQVPEDWFDPTQEGQFTNEMQNDSGIFRDQHIFKVLTTRARRGERVFAVIGVSHVPALEPALVKALGFPAMKRDGDKKTTRQLEIQPSKAGAKNMRSK
jgi:hypothetical protein